MTTSRATPRFAAKHHEIHLSDIRKAPETWKTIIRQPME
jgi:hypothetical protein